LIIGLKKRPNKQEYKRTKILLKTLENNNYSNAMSNSFRFFTHKEWESGGWSLLAATEGYGMLFNYDGRAYSSYFKNSLGIDYKKLNDESFPTAKEITLRQALNLFDSYGKKRILDYLDLKAPPPINITEEKKAEIINQLKQSRAFNQDSGMKMDDMDSCCTLTEQKIIKEFKGRFYIEKDLSNIKDLRDIPSIVLTQTTLNV